MSIPQIFPSVRAPNPATLAPARPGEALLRVSDFANAGGGYQGTS